LEPTKLKNSVKAYRRAKFDISSSISDFRIRIGSKFPPPSEIGSGNQVLKIPLSKDRDLKLKVLCFHSVIFFSDRQGQWFQVDFGNSVHLLGVITQGRANANQWVTKFKIGYGNATNEIKIIEKTTGEDKVSRMTTEADKFNFAFALNRFSTGFSLSFLAFR